MIGLDFSTPGEWLRGTGPESDVVISTRIRLARNIAGFNFINRANRAERRQIVAMAREHAIPIVSQLGTAGHVTDNGEKPSVVGERHGLPGRLAREDSPRHPVSGSQPPSNASQRTSSSPSQSSSPAPDGVPTRPPAPLFVDLTELDDLDTQLLVERHIISKDLAKGSEPRGVIVRLDESLSIMINEEDHLRLQVFRSGRRMQEAFDETNTLDDALSDRLPFAWHQRFGYLTACPTNVGTGIRFSMMLHLPALMLTKEIERVRRAAQDMQLAIRGFYGEGSDVLGDFFQISNQTTLGKSEEQILRDLDERVLPHVIKYEREARRVLVEKRGAMLDDRCFRALGVLRHARMMKVDEALKLLSHVRLGVQLGRITGVAPTTIDRLLILVQPAHLQKTLGRPLTQVQRTEARAMLIREQLTA